MFLVFRLCLIALLTNTYLICQVNTEAIRSSKLKEGFGSRIDLLFGLNAGNSEFISGEGKLRVDYLDLKYKTFAVGQISYKEGNNEIISNKGFLHGRFIYKMSDEIEPELFLQKEFNEFVLLTDRNLAGGGFRFRLSDTEFVKDSSAEFDLYFGLGAMYEMEEINTEPQQMTEILRSTNYFNLVWKPSENFIVSSVTYFQVDVIRFNDHRILNDTNLQFKITDAMSFVFNLSYRFDKEPPQGVKEYDLEIKNGITFEL